MAATVPFNGLTNFSAQSAKVFRMTATNTTSGGYITSNWASSNNTSAGAFGTTTVSVSSGVFSFVTTGLYRISFHTSGYINNESRYIGTQIIFTNDNSTYNDNMAVGYDGMSKPDGNTGNNYWAHASSTCIADVTNTTNQKCKMYLDAAASTSFQGSSDINYTYVMFERLGDT